MAKEYEFKLVTTPSGREMWYHKGKLVAKTKVPEGIQNLLRASKEDSAPEDESLQDVQLSGFTDLETQEKDAASYDLQQKKAVATLKKHFPDFEYHVQFRPAYKTQNGVKVPDRYIIDITRNGTFIKSITSIGFNLPRLKENIEGIFEGWVERPKPSRRRGTMYTKDENISKENLGTKSFSL